MTKKRQKTCGFLNDLVNLPVYLLVHLSLLKQGAGVMKKFLPVVLCGWVFGWGEEAWAVDLVKDGKEALPIIVPEKAPASARQAADQLAEALEKISGAKVEIRADWPSGAAGAVWVGHHEKLAEVFPGVDFSWKHPEEILIVSKGANVAVLGRDREVAGVETESGTANAVFTFLQKYLGVRWLWPGALGEDLPANATVTLPEFEYRFHPPFVQRSVFRNLGANPLGNPATLWCLRERIYYDSFDFPATHAFGDWWDKYGKDHPEYFALQPDGTRGTFPERGNRKKLCEAEPGVWRQWLADAAEDLAANPAQRVLHAAPNDSANSGICVDPRCQAWDHPQGKLWRYEWAGESREAPALTNRYVTFWNRLAEMLKEKFPDKDVLVGGFAYGPSKPAPIDLEAADNVAIGYVGHLPMLDDRRRMEEYAEIAAWGKATRHLIFRPNVALYSGGFHAVPAVTFKNTIRDFRFLAENGCRGLVIDTLPDHWGTQGPMYYLMAQLAWDPLQDGEAVLKDYFARAFGPAAEPMRQYFDLMESAHQAILERPDWIHSGRMGKPLSEYMIADAYTADVLEKGRSHLDEAAERAAANPKYSERVQFFRKGLDFTEQLIATMKMMNRVRASGGRDVEAVEEAERLVAAREAFFETENAYAKKTRGIAPISSHRFKVTYSQSRKMFDHLGPVSETFRKAAAEEKANPTRPAASSDQAAAGEGSVAAGEGNEYRWTGRAGNGLWDTPANWEVRTEKGWTRAAQPPGRHSVVFLGDDADLKNRELNLTANVEVAKVHITARDQSEFVIQTRPDADTEGLDSDSGMLFTLTLADPMPIQQEPGTVGNLVVRSKLALTGGTQPLVRVDSTHGAVVELAGQLTAGIPTEKRSGGVASGKLVVPTQTK